MRSIRVACVAIALAALTAPVVFGQARGLGAINGTVSAEEGEAIPGAVVKVHLPNGDALEGKSDDKGKWNVMGLGKGEFQVEFAKDGFVTKRVKLVIEKETLRSEPIKISMKKG